MSKYLPPTYEVINVTPGIVRNLLKTTFYLRIPRQESDNKQKQDRDGQTIPLPPNTDVEIFWKDFDVVSGQLEDLQRQKVLLIIQYPMHAAGEIIAVQKDGVTVVSDVSTFDFHGFPVTVTDEGNNTAGIALSFSVLGTEVAFADSDWVNDQIMVIPTGAPAAGQVGPHLLPVVGRQFVINPFRNIDVSDRRPVDMSTYVDFTTGFITILKAPVVPAFSGVLVITVTLP
jgi:hypothetical protein